MIIKLIFTEDETPIYMSTNCKYIEWEGAQLIPVAKSRKSHI